MSYSPTTWQNGDTITAAKLNNMESGITAGENGWEVTTNTLFSESITTAGSSPAPVANLAYTTLISADPLTVTFEGTDYTPPVAEMGGMYAYGDVGGGGPDFTNYPFYIVSTGAANMVYTENEGTYSISARASSVTTTADFAEAVAVASSPEIFVATKNVTTWQEVHDAVAAKKLAFVYEESGSDLLCYPVLSVTSGGSYEVATAYVSMGGISARYYQADTADGPIYPN